MIVTEEQLIEQARNVLDPYKTFNVTVRPFAPEQARPYAVAWTDADEGRGMRLSVSPTNVVTVPAVKAKREGLTPGETSNLFARLVRRALGDEPESLFISLDGCLDVENAANGIALGLLSPQIYKMRRDPDDYAGPKQIVLVHAKAAEADVQNAIAEGFFFGGLQNLQRWLGAQAPNVLTIGAFAQVARALAQAFGGQVIEPTEDEYERMGLLQAVCRASGEKPRVIAIGSKIDAPVHAVVGKGMVMDTGGVSLKTPNANMLEMNADMMGAAAALGAALFFLQRPQARRHDTVYVLSIGVNDTGSRAYRPEDVLTGYDGQTVRVVNTDAEGRLALADAVSWACERFHPERVTTIATLTGAAHSAFGDGMSAVMVRGNDLDLLEQAETVGEDAGDEVNRLLMRDEDDKAMRDERADLRNLAEKPARGAQTAAAFVFAHVPKGIEAVHLDIPRAASHGGSEEMGLAKGLPIGAGVSLLISLEISS